MGQNENYKEAERRIQRAKKGKDTLLDLASLHLTELPESILSLSQLTMLILNHNQLTTPPQHIAEQGARAIRLYFEQAHKDGLFQHHTLKLQIVGNPESGKTTLYNQLGLRHHPNPPFIPLAVGKDDRTYGVNVHSQWTIKSSDQEYMVNIWDYGGQQIQYMTHQFLLSGKSLFLFLVDRAKVEDNTDYWFEIMSTLGQQSPIICVLNHKEEDDDNQPMLSLDKYRKQFPELDIISVDVNLHDENECLTLYKKLERKICQLKYDAIPKSWLLIDEALSKENTAYIRRTTFDELCTELNIDSRENRELCLFHLNAIGKVIYYDHMGLRNTVFLKPEWVAKAIYHVFQHKHIQRNDGLFTREWLHREWEKDYNEEEIEFLMQLMLKDHFNVCYEMPDKEHLIIPLWLPEQRPHFEKQNEHLLHFRYTYKFLPSGMIPHLMVAFHEDIAQHQDKSLHWRHGFVLNKDGAFAYVEVQQATNDTLTTIDVQTTGELPARKKLLETITDKIENLHKQLKLSHFKLSILCYGCAQKGETSPRFHPHTDVTRDHRKDERGVLSKAFDCMKCGQTISSEILLGGYELSSHAKENLQMNQNNNDKSSGTTNIFHIGDGNKGPIITGNHATVNQMWQEIKNDIDLKELAKNLQSIKEALNTEAGDNQTPEQHKDIQVIAAATNEARNGNGEKALDYLKTATKWTWGIAEKIGVGVSLAFIKIKLGF